MLFADNIDKKLLPKNILILNARKKTETLVEFCLKYDINFKMYELANNEHFNISEKLKPHTHFLPREQLLDPQYYINNIDFVPEYIINFRDEEPSVKLEYELMKHWNPKTQFDERAFKFFTSKKEQDRVAKLMGIPTLDEGNLNDKIIVKLDKGESGGGTGYKIVRRKRRHVEQPNDFIQRYIDYDYTINQHFIIDDNGEYHIYNHFLGVFGDDNIVGNNIAYLYKYPYPTNYFQKEDIAVVEEFFTKLKDHISVRNRIGITEFSKERHTGKLRFQEFNCRPSGEFELGGYDWNAGKFNTIVDYFTNNIPKEIEYYQQSTEIYFDNVYNNAKFGWGNGEGLKIERLPFKETIKVFNTKDK
jgi:hypothetical protein